MAYTNEYRPLGYLYVKGTLRHCCLRIFFYSEIFTLTSVLIYEKFLLVLMLIFLLYTVDIEYMKSEFLRIFYIARYAKPLGDKVLRFRTFNYLIPNCIYESILCKSTSRFLPPNFARHIHFNR